MTSVSNIISNITIKHFILITNSVYRMNYEQRPLTIVLAEELGQTSMKLQEVYALLRQKEVELEMSEIQVQLLKNYYERSKSLLPHVFETNLEEALF